MGGGASETSNGQRSSGMTSKDTGIIKILYTNAQSILNKLDLLQAKVYELEPDLIAISESWTHKDIATATLNLKGYTIVGRSDRTDTLKGRGGGVLLYSRLSNVYEETGDRPEQIVHVILNNKDKSSDIHLHVVYRSPNSSLEVNEGVQKYVENVPDNSILIGDFNYPEINWSTLSSALAPGRLFLDTVNNKFLSQHVDFPTNLTPQPNGSVTATSIDLVLTDEDNLIASVKPVDHLGASHHVMMLVEVVVPTKSNDTMELVPDYNKANFPEMREKLGSINWRADLQVLDAVNSWNKFKMTVSSTVDSCVPRKKRRNSSKPLWMQRNVMRIIRKKRRLWNRYTTTHDYQSYLAFKRVQNEATSMIRKAKREFEKKLAASAKKNPKAFYQYLNSKCKVQSKVGPLKDTSGNVHTDDSIQAGLLNKKFVESFTREDLSSLPTPIQKFDPALGPPLSSIHVEVEKVKEKIDCLNPNKSCGPDGLRARTLRELSAELSEPITIIFNKCLNEGVVPDDWKLSNVTGIFKKGDKTDPGNYRPISLTCIICRILESILRDAILLHLQEYNLIAKSQPHITHLATQIDCYQSS
jgi:hypothetical protein